MFSIKDNTWYAFNSTLMKYCASKCEKCLGYYYHVNQRKKDCMTHLQRYTSSFRVQVTEIYKQKRCSRNCTWRSGKCENSLIWTCFNTVGSQTITRGWRPLYILNSNKDYVPFMWTSTKWLTLVSDDRTNTILVQRQNQHWLVWLK